jgi:hypothetical protein
MRSTIERVVFATKLEISLAALLSVSYPESRFDNLAGAVPIRMGVQSRRS